MIVHRCDVCRDEFDPKKAAEELQTVLFTVNLEKLAKHPNTPRVVLTVDLCKKPDCRKTGLEQIHAKGLETSLSLTNLLLG